MAAFYGQFLWLLFMTSFYD